MTKSTEPLEAISTGICICTYVCMYVCMCICKCIRVCAYANVFMYVHMQMYLCMCICKCICVCAYANVFVYVHVGACVYEHVLLVYMETSLYTMYDVVLTTSTENC